ncbi:MAG TPA: IPT/TIG domain-containing protein [Opitutaceae bacterium]|nr:IPT/TIG domain-containing protein [Opitutaceae bacterium]
MQHSQATFWKRGLLGAASALALLLTGCGTTIVNMTSDTVAENPSSIYTITARVKPAEADLVKNTLKVQIVIDGQIHPMTASPLGDGLYEFDYRMPAGRTEATYYLLVNYAQQRSNMVYPVEEYTELRTIKLTNRYVYTLEAVRGPIGARIAIVGRGFTPQDVVYLDSVPARTVFESPNAISFSVPAVPAGRSYKVSLNNGTTSQDVGSFRVDGLSLDVAPTELTLQTGGRATLTFSLGNPAPEGGLLVDVSTDVPQSVIMPEVIIPAGATTATITVQGGQPGQGNLFVTGVGSGEITIPVTVAAR